jgi:hypothetical protein
LVRITRPNPRVVGVALFAVLVAAFAIALGAVSPSAHAQEDAKATTSDATVGTTEGWFNGKTVTFLYTRPYFCAQPPNSGADSGCEVGERAQTAPIGYPDVPELWVIVPLGFTPPADSLQCPVAGDCIDHPHDIDLSRVLGAGVEDVPLPAHSHVIDDLQGGWWKTFVVGVTTQDAWDRIVAGKDLATVRALQHEQLATGDIPSNLFIFFNVLP